MAMCDYKLCDLCGRKAFYDADIRDAHYVATYDSSEAEKPVGIAVLCADCNLTHEAIIRPRCAPDATHDFGDDA